MSCYDNRHLISPFSPEFETIHTLWKEHLDFLRIIGETSAFHTHAEGATFEGGKPVFSFSEILNALQSILTLLRTNGAAFKAEAQQYLVKHRAFLWFYYAMQALYHPSEADRKDFALFFEGSWGEFDLSYDTYIADKERKDARGKTKNPNYVDTHVCCSNCICYYDDTPDYEWSKEDEEESKASNNIRINYSKKAEFERQVLQNGVLETWREHWEEWEPPKGTRSRSLALDEYWLSELKTTVSVAAKYAKSVFWRLPSEMYFSFLWDNQDEFEELANQMEASLRDLQSRYKNTKEWEDEVVEDARKGIKNLQIALSFLEEESLIFKSVGHL
jgi:hypothetical protein